MDTIRKAPGPVNAEDDSTVYGEYLKRRPWSRAEGLLLRWQRRMFRHFLSVSNADRRPLRIVEVGTGYGLLAGIIAELGHHYLGVEMNAALAALTGTLGVEVVTCTIPPFPERAIAFTPDVIWLSHVVEHNTSWRAAREMLLAARATLGPKGQVVIVGPDALWWQWEFWNVDWSHGYATTLNNVRQLLSDSGFEIVYARHHTCGIFNPPLRWTLERLFLLVPVRIIDLMTHAVCGRNLAYSFMTVFGWRQIFVIARVSTSGTAKGVAAI